MSYMKFRNERKVKILLADRNEASRHFLRTALSLPFFVISEAKDQDAILDLVKRDQVDIICLDTSVDHHLELLRAIKLLSSSIGVILISTDISRRAVLRAVENGADDFIMKPYAPGRIRNAIIQCFGSRKRIPVSDPQPIELKPIEHPQAACTV